MNSSMAGNTEMEEELAKAKTNSHEALQELEEIKWKVTSGRTEILEAEARKAMESERQMLESLTLQTRQLEQTKISLEEAKIENESLKENIHSMEIRLAGRGAFKTLEKSTTMSAGDELSLLRDELELALDAEDKNRKAMDGLASALQEVTSDSISAKQKLCNAESDLAKAEEEIEQLRDCTLKQTKADLAMALDENKRLKLESEELVTSCNEKEQKGIAKCMKMCEENSRLLESQRSATKKEISDMKQAVEEATMGKKTLEHELRSVKRELECAKASEAAALDVEKRLQSLLVAKTASSTLEANSEECRGGARDHHQRDGSMMEDSADHEKQEEALAAAAVRVAGSASRRKEKTKSFGGSGSVGGGAEHRELMDGEEEERSKSQMRQKRRPLFRKFADLLAGRASHK